MISQPGALSIVIMILMVVARAALRHHFQKSVVRWGLDLLRATAIWFVSFSEALELAYIKFHDVKIEIESSEKIRYNGLPSECGK